MNKDIVKNAIICLSNMKIEELTYQLARDIVIQEYEAQVEEIERLNNIINELEKELEQEIAVVGANRKADNNNPEWWYKLNCYNNILDKLKELKGEENE